MSASPKKLRVRPLPKADSIKLTFACQAQLKAKLDRYCDDADSAHAGGTHGRG